MNDPLGSVMWDALRTEVFGDAPLRFDDGVSVLAPDDAEDARRVPVLADASALGAVTEMVLLADMNPFPLILRYRPQAARPVVATRFRVEQATPLRAAARTPDGVWHLGGRMLDAVGGGCSAVPAAYAASDWAEHVGEIQARAWRRKGGDGVRLRLRVRHPNDTGLVSGVPAYFIERLAFTDDAGTALAMIESLEPVSEDPVFTVELRPATAARAIAVAGRDNNGTEFAAVVALPKEGE